jgi:hypothetical protein
MHLLFVHILAVPLLFFCSRWKVRSPRLEAGCVEVDVIGVDAGFSGFFSTDLCPIFAYSSFLCQFPSMIGDRM